MCASFVTAWRTLSSIEPDTSPPCVCATGMFMYEAAIAVAIVSKRSATVSTTSGWSSSNTVGSSSRPRPVDFAIVAGVSPSMMKRMVASGAKPSMVTTSSALPNRSSTSDAPATSWSSSSGWSRIASSPVLIRA